MTINRTYDGAGRLTTASSSSISYLTNCYDGNGPCPGSQNHLGPNSAGKLTHQVSPNPGFPSSITPQPGSISDDFEYADPAGRMSLRATSISSNTISPVTQTWKYDPAGEIVTNIHPHTSGLFAVGTAYDHGFPTGVWANGVPVVISATYQPSGMLASYVTGNNTGHNVTTTIGVDPNSIPRPASFTTSGATQNFSSGTYSYDGAGNITQIGTDTFTYDRILRLTNASYGATLGQQSFSYDQFGNLTGTTGTNPRSYSIDTRYNQLTNNNASYDGRGNLKAIGPTPDHYFWDNLDRNTEYTSSGGVDWKYLYDGASERILKISATNSPSDYVWTFRDESNRIVTEYTGPNGPVLNRDNVYLGNLLVGSYSSCGLNGPPGWTYYSSDHLGTPRLVTDALGNTIDTRKYWPYGDEASVTQAASAQRLRFAAMERDTEASRYSDHARGSEFQLAGRFLSVDRKQPNALHPQSLNRYAYAQGNPIIVVDLTGLGGDVYLFNLFPSNQISPQRQEAALRILSGTGVKYRNTRDDLPTALQDSTAHVILVGHTLVHYEGDVEIADDFVITPRASASTPTGSVFVGWDADTLFASGLGGSAHPADISYISCISNTLCGPPLLQQTPGVAVENSPYSSRLLVFAATLAKQLWLDQTFEDAIKVAQAAANQLPPLRLLPGQPPDENVKSEKRLPCISIVRQVGNLTGFCPGQDE